MCNYVLLAFSFKQNLMGELFEYGISFFLKAINQQDLLFAYIGPVSLINSNLTLSFGENSINGNNTECIDSLAVRTR